MSFGSNTTDPYVQVGSSGLFVYRVGLGTMQFGWSADEPQSLAILDAYTQVGGNFIDTADCYSSWAADMGGPNNPGGVSEEIIGRWIQKRGHRDDLVIATKVRAAMGERFSDTRATAKQREGLSRRWILQACEDSLRRLGVDHLDLYQAHFIDPLVPIEETMSTFTDLVRQGKVRYLGCSNFSAWRLMQALWVSDKRGFESFVSIQPEYSMLSPTRGDFETELAQVCQTYGIGVVPYSPLAGGMLSGKYRRGATPPDSVRAEENIDNRASEKNWDIIDALIGAAAELGQTPAQVAINWIRSKPWVSSPIIGVNTVAQLTDVLSGLDGVLPDEQRDRLDQVSDFHRPRSAREQ
jgi:aryl-alcohol dehydrogenase-like predicted oxidoreductase